MNLLFDLDGTLADPFESIKTSLIHALTCHQLECPTDARVKECIGPPLQQSLAEVLQVPADLVKSVMDTYRAHQLREGIFLYRFYEQARPTLETLSRKHRLFVATSKLLVSAQALIRHFDFEKYFDGIHGSDPHGACKKAEIILEALRTHQLDASQTLMIGDREHDAIGARVNQVRSIGVTWGFGSQEELMASGVEKAFGNWADLRHWLMEQA